MPKGKIHNWTVIVASDLIGVLEQLRLIHETLFEIFNAWRNLKTCLEPVA